MLSKGDLMELTNNTTGVDCALPEGLVQELQRMGFDRNNVIYTYAMSYKGGSGGKLINLQSKFLELLDNTPMKATYSDDTKIIHYNGRPSILDFIKSLLQNTDKWEIKLR